MLKFPARESWLFHVDGFCPYKARNDQKQQYLLFSNSEREKILDIYKVVVYKF